VTLEAGSASGCVDALGAGDVAVGPGGVSLDDVLVVSSVEALGAFCTLITTVGFVAVDDEAVGVVDATPPVCGASSGNGTAGGLVTAGIPADDVLAGGGHVALVTLVSTACSSVSAFMKTASPTKVSQTIVNPIAGATNKTRFVQCIDMQRWDASTEPTTR